MDVFALSKVGTEMVSKMYRKLNPNKDHFVSDNTMTADFPVIGVKSFSFTDILGFILGVIIGVYAAWLSWQCNSKLGYNVVLKVLFAILAYFFGLVYLILYVVLRWDVCKKI